MTWHPLAPIRPWVVDRPGMCLRYAQSFFGAPVAHRSAWHAFQHVEHRHGPKTPLPDVPVPVWFSHYGTYNDGLGPYDGNSYGWGNWGHVAIHVPGDAIYTSPASGNEGFERYATIAQIERVFNSTYAGWSEDLNGLRVAEQTMEDDMFSDDDRKMLRDLNAKAGRINAIYDALFMTSPTSRGTRGGVLTTLKAIDDAQFKTEETSFGTPGGTLATLRAVLDRLDAIEKKIDG